MPRAGLDDVSSLLLKAPAAGRPDLLFARLGEALVATGLPVWRMSTALHTTDPQLRALHLTWVRGEATRVVERDHDMMSSSIYVGTPVARIIEGEADEIRCRLDVARDALPHPVLAELSDMGGTDYAVFPLEVSDSLSAGSGTYWRRQWISFATTAARGFSDEDLAFMRELLPLLALRLAHEAAKHASRALLRAYLGANASERILAGAFRRGTAQEIEAVIYFCDMRGFTTLSDTTPAAEVVRVLDAYFDAVASPIDEQGGEVLKFIGDAVLGIFPIGADAVDAGRRALAAAGAAQRNLDALNGARRGRGEPPLGLGIALHAGAVMYGNIGAKNRLDFTVIGAPVNEACRVEAMTRSLGRDVLLTATFVRRAGIAGAVSLGRHALKGVAEPQELFAPP